MDLLYEILKEWSVLAVVAVIVAVEILAEILAEVVARPLANKIKQILGINGDHDPED